MNFEKVKAIMKWLWIAAVFVFVAVYLLSKKRYITRNAKCAEFFDSFAGFYRHYHC
jgi:hypothetical protein